MNLDTFNIRVDIIHKLYSDVSDLIDALSSSLMNLGCLDEGEKIFEDVSFLRVIHAYLSGVNNLLYAELSFLKIFIDIEDDKSKFMVQKAMNELIKERLFCELDNLLYIAKTWSFNDYRVRKFQEDLRRDMSVLCDLYKREYNIQ